MHADKGFVAGTLAVNHTYFVRKSGILATAQK